MLSGYYTIASGMMANQKNLDVIGNNLLNVQTVGFRAERATITPFEQEMMTVSDKTGQKVLGDGIGSPIAVINSESTMFGPGTIEATGRSLDVAINGEGFFNITGEDGETYLTRSGGFDLDTAGYLILPGAGRVLGAHGYIKTDGTGLQIAADGTVFNSSGEELGEILVTAPEDDSSLERTERGFFTSADALPVSKNYQLVQKSLELSNVDMNVELANLIAAQRAFQGCSSALSTIDSMNRRAVQQIAAI